jgi:hypothetical protein
MNLMKQVYISIFIALLMIVNINFYLYDDNSLLSSYSLAPNKVQTELKSQQFEHFSFIDQQHNLQISLDRFQKNTFKITLSKWKLSKVISIQKENIAKACYFLFSSILVLKLDKSDIIFPFQYFW